MKLTAIIRKEEDMYVALCPELDITSQGYTIEEAISLFFECASKEEIKSRLPSESLYITPIEVATA